MFWFPLLFLISIPQQILNLAVVAQVDHPRQQTLRLSHVKKHGLPAPISSSLFTGFVYRWPWMTLNYAHESGIYSIAAAISFAAVYAPFFLWFLYMSFRRPIHVHYGLALFCAVRITAFSIRAALAGSTSAAEHLALVDADEILFSVGFLVLLYTSHKLVLDFEYLIDQPLPRNFVFRVLGNRWFFHVLLVAAITTAIASACTSDGDGTDRISNKLEIASTVIFLVLTLLQAFHTIVFAWIDISASKKQDLPNESFVKKYGVFILLLIPMLFLVREGFSAATITNWEKYNNEHFWYPLVVIPEFLTVILYTTPKLIPSKEEFHFPTRRV